MSMRCWRSKGDAAFYAREDYRSLIEAHSISTIAIIPGASEGFFVILAIKGG
jgi:hypothetical protein